MYGGTRENPVPVRHSNGLSPRVRGNLRRANLSVHAERSIPACTGEPRSSSPKRYQAAVYPRVYGGTFTKVRASVSQIGLSPRVRGNRLQRLPSLNPLRSIPACTGEPHRPRERLSKQQVYPRVYGGTRQAAGCSSSKRGLSPRVRGNRLGVGRGRSRLRSIPACTGEPKESAISRFFDEVYPRVYGGTMAISTWGRL